MLPLPPTPLLLVPVPTAQNSDPCTEPEGRLGAAEGAGVEVDLISACCALTGVEERTDVDLSIGVLEHDPLVVGLEHDAIPPAVAPPPSSTFPPSLDVRVRGKLWREVGEVLLQPPVVPGGSVRGRLVNPT